MLQIFTETGAVGLGLILTGLLYCARWCLGGLARQNPQSKAFAAAVTTGLVVSATHAIFDFTWHIPACLSTAVMMAAAAYALATPSHESQASRSRNHAAPQAAPSPAAAGLAWTPVCGLLALLVFIQAFIGPAIADSHWTRYRRLARDSKSDMRHWLTAGQGESDRARKQTRSLYEDSRRMVAHLERTIQADPQHSRAHWRLTEQYIRLFEFAQQQSDNAMGLSQIRDAANASEFPSREALDEWMSRAVGEPRALLSQALHHTQQALRNCPLQGRVYLYAADLAFLQGIRHEGTEALIKFALRVNPYDAAVLFTLGREAALAGDVEAALSYWRKSFGLSHEYREAIINSVARQMPAETFLEVFDPDELAMESLLSFYRSQNMLPPAQVVAPFVLQRLAEQAETKSGIASAKLWQRRRDIQRFLGDTAQALESATRAVTAAPNWFEGRIGLADEYLASQHLDDSLREYRWCLRRRPNDSRLRAQTQNLEIMIARQDRPDANVAQQPATPPLTSY